MKLLVLAIFLFAFFVSTVPAASYYVSNSGNDQNAGTESSPWATLVRAERAINPGDSLYLSRDSTWKTQFAIRSSNIVVDAYGSGELPTIDGSGLYFSLLIAGKSDITIRNLKLVNATNDCIRFEQGGVNAHNLLIEKNIITGCKTNGINISPSNADIAADRLPYGIQIIGNKISNCGNSGIIIRGQANIGVNRIASNTIDNVGTMYPTNAISLHYVHNIIVENNVITNTRSTQIDGSGITADYLTGRYGTGSIIRSNTVKCPSPTVNDIQAGIAVWYQPNVEIYNNTIIGCNEGIRVSGAISSDYNIHHNKIIRALKKGVSLTDKAGKGRLEYNNMSGFNNDGYAISINPGSNAPDEKHNNFYNFRKAINDTNKPSLTPHLTDTAQPF